MRSSCLIQPIKPSEYVLFKTALYILGASQNTRSDNKVTSDYHLEHIWEKVCERKISILWATFFPAFDTVDFIILLSRLQHCVGLQGNVLIQTWQIDVSMSERLFLYSAHVLCCASRIHSCSCGLSLVSIWFHFTVM